MRTIEQTQRPSRQHVLALWQRRNQQRTVKIRPYSLRPNLLGEVPQVNTIGVGQGGARRVRLAGGDLIVGQTSEQDWYYPTSRSFSENATQSGNAGEEVTVQAGRQDEEKNVNNFTPDVEEDRDEDRCGF